MIGSAELKKNNSISDYSNIENFQEMDDEGQRPHESLGIATHRDTPIKTGALANKNLGTNDLKNNKLKCEYTSNVIEKTKILKECNH